MDAPLLVQGAHNSVGCRCEMCNVFIAGPWPLILRAGAWAARMVSPDAGGTRAWMRFCWCTRRTVALNAGEAHEWFGFVAVVVGAHDAAPQQG